jgi:hypothetical protein
MYFYFLSTYGLSLFFIFLHWTFWLNSEQSDHLVNVMSILKFLNCSLMTENIAYLEGFHMPLKISQSGALCNVN